MTSPQKLVEVGRIKGQLQVLTSLKEWTDAQTKIMEEALKRLDREMTADSAAEEEVH